MGRHAPKGDKCPIVGHLDGPLIKRMDTVRARMKDEGDIQAAALRKQREEQERWRREERGFLDRNRAFRGAITSKLKLKGGQS